MAQNPLLPLAKHIFTISTCFYCSPVLSQMMEIPAAPFRSSVDERGVDLVHGRPIAKDYTLSIGTSGNGLSHQRSWTYDGWRHNYMIAAYEDPNTGVVVVSLGDRSDRFNWVEGVGYVPEKGDGATFDGTTYTYSGPDGTTITFDSGFATYSTNGVDVAHHATLIIDPSGVRTSLTYKFATGSINGLQVYVKRLQSVSTSTGFMLKYAYVNNSFSGNYPLSSQLPWQWLELASVTAINTAVDYCDPAGDSCSGSTSWPIVLYGKSLSGADTIYSITDPAGRISLFTVDSSRRLVAVRRPSSAWDTVTYAYNGSSGSVVATTTPTAGTWSYSRVFGSYPSGDPMTTVTTAKAGLGNRVDEVSFKLERITKHTDQAGQITNIEYDTSGRTKKVTRPEGDWIEYFYDARGNPTSAVQHPKSGSGTITTSATFPASCTNLVLCNKPVTVTDARGKVTTYSYDATHGGVTKVTLPARPGGVQPEVRYDYTPLYPWVKDSSGSLVSTPAAYMLTSISECQLGGPTSCSSTDEARTTLTYEAGSSSARSNLFPLFVDKGTTATPQMARVKSSYDAVGNVVAVEGPQGSADTSRMYYNSARELVGVVGPDPDGALNPRKPRALKYSYGTTTGLLDKVERGTVTNPTDNPSGLTVLETVSTGYDSNGRKIQDAVGPVGTPAAVTQYSYDSVGRPSCVAQRMNMASLLTDACTLGTPGANGPDRITRTQYTLDSRVKKVQNALGVTTANGFPVTLQRDEVTNHYSANGKVDWVRDAKGNQTSYGYDGYDRMVTTTYPDASYEQLTLDDGGNVTQRRLRDGQLVNYTFDNLGRMSSKDLPGTEPDVSYAYDNLGRLTSATQSGNALSFTYDALGRNLTQVGPLGTISSAWDAAGRRTQLAWPDTSNVTYDYLVTGEMTAIRESGSTALVSFGYDDLGRRSGLSRANGASTSYGYDAVSRLTSLVLDPASTARDLTLGFGYSPASQITSRTSSNDAYAWTQHYNLNRGYTTNALNQYLTSGAVIPTYDGRGNLLSAGATTYSYSSENMLKSASNGTTLGYDPAMRLYETAKAPVTTRFAYDGDALIAEYDGSNTLLRRFVHGPGSDEPLVWYEGSGIGDKRWLHADERGSIVAISNASGAVTDVNSYDEYGIPQTANQGRFRYTGQAWLPELGIYYYKARIYSPTLGRFLQPDPIGYSDGMNLYAYVKDDPVNGRDPSGLEITADGNYLITANSMGGCGGAGITCYNIIEFSLDMSWGGEIGNPLLKSTAIPYLPQNITPCGQSGLDTLIGAASAVGGFAQDVGDVGQIIGGAVAFVNPVLGGAIFTGSKVISGVGTGLEVGAALGDAYLNGNTGGLANAGVSALGGLAGSSAINRLRSLEFGGRVGRNALGQFARHPANVYANEIKRGGNLVGSKAAGSAVCR